MDDEARRMIDNKTGIWDLDTVKKGGHKHDESLLEALFTLYTPKIVADLGCGDGWYCKELKELGWPEIHGYEGCEDMREHGVYNDLFILDLTKKRWVDIPYDLVLCLEVGEHIPKDHEQVFLDNVVEFGKEAFAIVLSWAVPGQGGRGHFNEQPNDYVMAEMNKRGFERDTFATNYLRERASLRWFKNTLVVYGRKRVTS